MSFYSDASLVMIPSGYKDQKVYCAKPTDGSGDLTFSRASNATRVASNGLIEKVRTNEILYSQDFSNAEWSAAVGITLTHGQTDPNGGTTATKVEFSASGQAFEQEIGGLSTSTLYSFSIWVRCDSGTISFEMGNLNALSFETKTATTTWQRFSITQTPSATTRYPRFVQGTAASTLYIAFAQLEVSDFGATPYIPTTTTAVSVGPVSGLPRLDYLNSSCPRLLLEPQRTNLALFSEQFDNAAWTKVETTISANSTTSPDGYTNADTLIDTAVTLQHRVDFSVSGTGGTIYTYSCYAKEKEYSKIMLRTGDGSNCVFDLAAGVSSSSGTATATISNVGNGWYRCVASQIFTTTGTMFSRINLIDDSGNITFTGTGTSGVYIWGAQLEAGAYATSYIPTLGTSVTRVAEVASKTSASALIGTTEGAFFIDFIARANVSNSRAITITGGSQALLLFFEPAGTGNVGISSSTSGLTYIEIGGASDKRYKIAYAWKANDYALYVNGVSLAVTQSASTFTGLDRIDLNQTESGSERGKTIVSQLLLFKTRLTNDQLAELTA
jgi:hypothetical protein